MSERLSDAELRGRLVQLGLNLTVQSARQLATRLERDPSAAELALFDAMWSEHCSYKSTRHLLRRLPTQAANVVLGPGADAGVVRLPRLDADRPGCCVVIAHESHNHPSQLLPYEGAATGIGGIVRDVYCMGADVVGVLDALRFGDPRGPNAERVRQITRGVVNGIAAYGNALGVPNLGGEVEFDAAFDDNCLVNVVALGMLDEDDLLPSRAPDVAGRDAYVLLLVGKPTDDSGLGGASFASVVLDSDEVTQNRGAVQLPDPFFKRVLTEANHAALALLRRHGASFAMKDLGAAGIGGATSEIAGELGLDLNLDAVHTDGRPHPAAALLVAETQERYALCVPATMAAPLQHLYEVEFQLGAMVRGAGARVIGRFDMTGRFRVRHQGRVHVDVPTLLVTTPIAIEWPSKPRQQRCKDVSGERAGLEARDVGDDLLCLLGSLGCASRLPVFGHYDSDVQGHTVVRPGEANAGVLWPDRDRPFGVAVATAGPSRLGWRDAYRAGAAAVCDAARKVVAVGATPWALTDCLNFGSPENPECMQDLVDAVRGLSEAASAIGLRGHAGDPLPFVSGNVSLYNQSESGSAIPPTPIVACLGVLADVGQCRVPGQQQPGDLLLRVGAPSTALGASLYAEVVGQEQLSLHDALPELLPDAQRQEMHAVLDAFAAGWIHACRSVGAGGDLVALVKLALGRDGEPTNGIRLALEATTEPLGARLFAEAPGFVVAVAPAHRDAFAARLRTAGVAHTWCGEVLDVPELHVEVGTKSVCRLALIRCAQVWCRGLADLLREEVGV